MVRKETVKARGSTTHTADRPSARTSADAGISIPCAAPTGMRPVPVVPRRIAAGGSICSLTQWRDTCHVVADMVNPDCIWGYSSIGSPCTTSYTGSKFCNLGPSYDFNSVLAGDQDGLLPTGSPFLQNCQAPWTGLLGNTSGVFDMTGNLREITRLNATTYTLMGGAFNSSSEAGSSCDFTFYNVDNEFKFFDTGFRCCFTTNPN